MNFNHVLLLTFIIGSRAFAQAGQQGQFVTTITSGSHVTATKCGLFKDDRDEIMVASGTAFLMESNGKPLLITAAHCVVLSKTQVADITKCESAQVEMGEIRISRFALKPIRILLDVDNDIAVIELTADDIKLLNLRPLKYKEQKFPIDAKVWGFPFKQENGIVGSVQVGTPDIRKATITDINPQTVTVSVDVGETGSGYSGGPMVVGDDEVVAVTLVNVSAQKNNNQTRGCNMKHVEALLAAFETKATKYSDPPIK